MQISDQIEYSLFRGLVHLLRLAGPGAAGDLLAHLGLALGRMGLYRRQVVLTQLARAFPELTGPELHALTDRVFVHLGRTVGEVFGSDPAAAPPVVEVDPGWEILDTAMAAGRGVIVATGHIGNFEFGGAVLAQRYPLLDVVKPQRNTRFDNFVNAMRAQRGILTVDMGSSGPAALRQLRRGGLVALLLDQDAGAEGLAVDFLGRRASTWPGAARLSLHTGCPVVPMALVRVGDRGHRLIIRPALWPDGRSGEAGDVQEYLQQISRAVEGIIQDYPEQWFWVHRRWKSEPQEGKNKVT